MPSFSPPCIKRARKANVLDKQQSYSIAIKQTMSKLSDILMQGGDSRKRPSSNSNASSSKVSSGNGGSIMSLRMRAKLSGVSMLSAIPKAGKNKSSIIHESTEYSKKHRHIADKYYQQYQPKRTTQLNFQQKQTLIVSRKSGARQVTLNDNNDDGDMFVKQKRQSAIKSGQKSKKRIKSRVLSFVMQGGAIDYEEIERKLQKYRLRRQNSNGVDDSSSSKKSKLLDDNNKSSYNYANKRNYTDGSNYSNPSTCYLKPVDGKMHEDNVVIQKDNNKRNSKLIINHSRSLSDHNSNNHNQNTNINTNTNTKTSVNPKIKYTSHNNSTTTTKKQKPVISYSLLLNRTTNNNKNLSINLKDHLKYNNWLQIKHQKLSTHHNHPTKRITNQTSQKKQNHHQSHTQKHQPSLLLQSHVKNSKHNNSKQKSKQRQFLQNNNGNMQSAAERRSVSTKKALSSFYIQRNHKVNHLVDELSAKKSKQKSKQQNVINYDNVLVLDSGQEDNQQEADDDNNSGFPIHMGNNYSNAKNNSFLDSLGSQQLYNNRGDNSNSKNSNYHSKSSNKHNANSRNMKSNSKTKDKHNKKHTDNNHFQKHSSNKKKHSYDQQQSQLQNEDQKVDNVQMMRELHKKYQIQQLTMRLKQQLRKISSAIKESKQLTSNGKVKKHSNDNSSSKKVKHKKKSEIKQKRTKQKGDRGRISLSKQVDSRDSVSQSRQIKRNQQVLLQQSNNNRWGGWVDKQRAKDSEIRMLNFESGVKQLSKQRQHKLSRLSNIENNSGVNNKSQQLQVARCKQNSNKKHMALQKQSMTIKQQQCSPPSGRISIMKQVQEYRLKTSRQQEENYMLFSQQYGSLQYEPNTRQQQNTIQKRRQHILSIKQDVNDNDDKHQLQSLDEVIIDSDKKQQQQSQVIMIGKDEFATPLDDYRLAKQHTPVLIKQLDDLKLIEENNISKGKQQQAVDKQTGMEDIRMESLFGNISILSNQKFGNISILSNQNQHKQQQSLIRYKQQNQQNNQQQCVQLLTNDDNNLFISFATLYITILLSIANSYCCNNKIEEYNGHKQIGINDDKQSQLLQNLSHPLGCSTIQLLRMMRQYCMGGSNQQQLQQQYEQQQQNEQQQHQDEEQQEQQQQDQQQQHQQQQHISQQQSSQQQSQGRQQQQQQHHQQSLLLGHSNDSGQQLEAVVTHSHHQNDNNQNNEDNDQCQQQHNSDNNNSQYIIRPQIYTHLEETIISMLSNNKDKKQIASHGLQTDAIVNEHMQNIINEHMENIINEHMQKLLIVISKMYEGISSTRHASCQISLQKSNQQQQQQQQSTTIIDFYQQFLSSFSLALYDAINSILDQLRPFGAKGLPPIHIQYLSKHQNQSNKYQRNRNINKVRQYLFGKFTEQIFAIKLGLIIQDDKQIVASTSTSAVTINSQKVSSLKLPNQSHQLSLLTNNILIDTATPIRYTKQQDEHIKAQKLSQQIKSYLNKQSMQISKQLQAQYGYLQDVRFQIIYQLQMQIQQELVNSELITIGRILKVIAL